MDSRQLSAVEEVKKLKLDREKRFSSAEHGEIQAGLTTDIYFLRTKQALNQMGIGQTPVVAEIFSRRSGLLAGVDEVISLLKDQGVEVWALQEGTAFEEKEIVLRIKGSYDHFVIYETAILGFLASSTGWATAAREAKEAAGDKPVFCFGARHVHPPIPPYPSQ